MLSIAVDVLGDKVVQPYVEQAHVAFPVAVDTADVFGQAFGLKAIPVTFLVDEVGIVRLSGAGPSREVLAQIEEVLKEPMSSIRGQPPELPSAARRADLEQNVAASPDDWQSRLALARLLSGEGRHAEAVNQLQAAARIRPQESSIHFVWGLALLTKGDKDTALAKLKQARDLDPDNWRIRKQIWALEHPDKFYTGKSPDFGWQKEQIEREKKQQTK